MPASALTVLRCGACLSYTTQVRLNCIYRLRMSHWHGEPTSRRAAKSAQIARHVSNSNHSNADETKTDRIEAKCYRF
jgi:hypothetical protein